jgi:Rap1a immunity proteins
LLIESSWEREDGSMKALTVLAVVLLAAFNAPVPQTSDKDVLFWASDGNSLLRNCDETAPGFPSGSAASQFVQCDFWIAGMMQGVELSQQLDVDPLRSKAATVLPPPAQAQEERDKANLDFAKELSKLGIQGVAIPDADMCIPATVPVDQLRRVIIKWLKDNPTKLNQEAAMLTFAALRNTYACTAGVTATDWARQARGPIQQ